MFRFYRPFIHLLVLFCDFDHRIDVGFPGPLRIRIRFGSPLVILVFAEIIAWLAVCLTSLILFVAFFTALWSA